MTTKTELQTWINQAIRSLENSETPVLEVQAIAAFLLGHPREWVIAHPDFSLDVTQIKNLNHALIRLQNREPLAYITGQQAFYGLDFIVSPAVLIPRPETELMVEEAIQWLEANPYRRLAADIGTGSGVIAITLADTFPDLKMTGIDISEDALAIASKNVTKHNVQERVILKKNDLLSNIDDSFDLILANLPYIPTQTLNALNDLRYEPKLALDGGPDGLQTIRILLKQASTIILPGGAIFLEIEATLSQPTLQIARDSLPQAKIDLLFDFANLPRLVRIRL